MTKTQLNQPPPLALFDFDGTLTTKDSFMAFLFHTHGRLGVARHFLVLWPVLLLHKTRLLSNSRAKAVVTKKFYQGWPINRFQEKAATFCSEVIPQMLNPVAMAKLKWHQQQGHKVVVVSAMFGLVLKPWCASLDLQLIATDLEIKNGQLTGNFSTENCFGKEKARRVLEAGLLKSQPYVYAYGDSSGDKELLALANEAFYRRF